MKNMRTSFGTLLALVGLFFGAACGGHTEAKGPHQVIQSDLEREIAPKVSEEHQKSINGGNAAFAFDLYSEMSRSDDDNVFISPLSMSTAFAMLYAGARNETAAEMAGVFHYDLDPADIHPAYNWLDQELEKRGEGAKGSDDKPFRLKVANALWGLEGHPFELDYLDTLALNYGAGLSVLDFIGDSLGAVNRINDWVNEKTEGTIPTIVSPSVVTSLTRLVLTNAVYFNAAWSHKFDEKDTYDAPFESPNGSIDVATMHQTEYFDYGSGEGYQAVSLPYDGHELSMVIIVPDAGTFSAFEQGLTSESFQGIVEGLKMENVALSMPKFQFKGLYRMVAPLKNLGLQSAFGPEADFSGIDGTTDLSLSGVVHKSFVRVHEGGTEAAAATALIAGVTSVPPPPIEVKIDRPFLFAIQDHATGTIVFLGRVKTPKN